MKGRTIVVGGGGGVGGAVVELLLRKDRRVVATVRNAQARDALLKRWPALDDVVVMDIGHADGVADALAPVLGDGVPLDAVVMCAAISPYGPIETSPLAVLRDAFEINVVAGAAVFQACVPHLRCSKGRIIFTGSQAGRVTFPFIGFYSASKFALEGLIDGMRREVRRWGVNVVLVAPGAMQTKMVTDQLERIEREILSLPSITRELYGDLYEVFRAALANAATNSTRPEIVAEKIVEVLDTDRPETRYVVGPDAEELYDMPRRLSDREMDEIASLEQVNKDMLG